jgi:hypothetical protein
MSRIQSLATGKCPKYGTGEVFKTRGNLFVLRMPVMHEDCAHCGHHFEKEPGFFLGAMYVSYALTIAESVTVYAFAYYFVTRSVLILPIVFAVVIPLTFVNFRYSGIIWMYAFAWKKEPQG